MLERYKKRGGFVQLLNLIEGFPKAKQDQFLSMIAQESVAWEAELRSRILLFDHIIAWNPTVLGEIVSRIQPLVLATAMSGLPKDAQALLARYVATADRMKFDEMIAEKTPNAAEISTYRMRFVAETRLLLSSGVIRLDKYLPHMMIPENIEETLNGAGFTVIPETDVLATAHAVPTAAPGNDSTHATAPKEEIEALKKRLHLVIQENATLKQDLAGLRHKLDQIKKIA